MAQVTAEQFAAECEKLADTIGNDWTEPLGRVAELLHEGVRQNFASRRAAGGPQWPPRKDNLPHPLLHKSGALEGAATGQGSGAVNRIDAKEVQIGVDKSVAEGGIPGAGVHNFGYPAKNIPQREFMVVTGDIVDKAAEVIADDAVKQLGW